MTKVIFLNPVGAGVCYDAIAAHLARFQRCTHTITMKVFLFLWDGGSGEEVKILSRTGVSQPNVDRLISSEKQ